MSSEKFEILDEDLRSLFDDCKAKLTQLPTASGEERKKNIREIEKDVDEAIVMLQDMEDEVKIAPLDYKNGMTSKIRNYRKELDKISRDVKKASSNARSELFSAQSEVENMAAAQRSQVLQGTQSLYRASDSIARSHQVAAETDQIGTGIIEELGTQREQLTRTRERLHGTDDNLSRSRKILRTMARRVTTNKLVLLVIVILEVAILAGVVYYRFFSK